MVKHCTIGTTVTGLVLNKPFDTHLSVKPEMVHHLVHPLAELPPPTFVHAIACLRWKQMRARNVILTTRVELFFS